MSKKAAALKQLEMRCPVCNKDGLIWEGEDNDDGYRSDDWSCPNCKSEGKAISTVKFTHHEVTFNSINKFTAVDR